MQNHQKRSLPVKNQRGYNTDVYDLPMHNSSLYEAPVYQHAPKEQLQSPRSTPEGRAARRKRPERSAINPCTKYVLFFENFMLVIFGMAMTGLGAYILFLKDKVLNSVIDFFLDPACIMCLCGAIITFLCFLGCTGSLREIVCFLKMYYYFLCLILLAELAVAVVLFVSYYQPEIKEKVFPKDAFSDAILNYRNDPDMQTLIDSIQQDLQCCGMSDKEDGFLDWNDNVYFNCSPSNVSPEKCSVPFSCCRTASGDKINYQCGSGMMVNENGEVSGDTLVTNRIYTNGCIMALGDWINEHALVVGGVMLGILLPQIVVVIVTRNLIEMILIQKSKW